MWHRVHRDDAQANLSAPSASRDLAACPASLTLDGRGALRQVFVALVLVELLIVYLDIVVTYLGAIEHPAVQDITDMVIQNSFCYWFSGLQTLVLGLVALLITVRLQGDPASSRRRVLGWLVVTCFFVYMGFAGGTGFHEAMGTWFEETQNGTGLGAWILRVFPSYAEQIVVLPFIGLLSVFTVVWSWRELSRRDRNFVLAGSVCFVLAAGLDFVKGMETPHEWLTQRFGLNEDLVPHFSGIFEAFMKPFGTTLILYGYLDHLLQLCDDLHLRVVRRD